MTIINTQNWQTTDTTSVNKTLTFDFTPTSGGLLVIFASANATFFNLSAGWTEEAYFAENYASLVVAKVSDGTETSFSWTQNGAYPAIATVYELGIGATLDGFILPANGWTLSYDNSFVPFTYGPYIGDKVILQCASGGLFQASDLVLTSTGDQTIDHLANDDGGVTFGTTRHATTSMSVLDGTTADETWGTVDAGSIHRIVALFTIPEVSSTLVSNRSILTLTDLAPVDTLVVSALDATGVSVSQTDDAAWLTVTPSSGTEPRVFTATADPTGLPDGRYTGNITFSAQTPYPDLVVSVVFLKGNVPDSVWYPDPIAGSTEVTDASVSLGTRFTFSETGYLASIFYYRPIGANMTGVPIRIYNETNATEIYSGTFDLSGGGWGTINLPDVVVEPSNNYVVYIHASAGVQWSNSSGFMPNPVTNGSVTARRNLYSYAGSPTLPSIEVNSSYCLDVLYYSGAPRKRLLIDRESYSVSLFEGDSVQTVVNARTSEDLGETITATKNENWLSIIPSSGTEPADFIIDIDSTGLAVGTHTDEIKFSSPTYDDVFFSISITVYSSQELDSVFYPDNYPATQYFRDTNPIILGTRMRFSSAGKVFSLLFYKIDTNITGSITLSIARESDYVNTIVSKTVSGGLIPGWIRVDLNTPYQVEKEEIYVVSVNLQTNYGYTFAKDLHPNNSLSGDITMVSGSFTYASIPDAITSNGYGLDVNYVTDPPLHELIPNVESIDISIKKGSSTTRSVSIKADDQAGVLISQNEPSDWLAVSPGFGNSPAAFNAYLNTASLDVGQYTTDITFSADTYPSVVVPVSVDVIDPTLPVSLWQPADYPNAEILSDNIAYNLGTGFAFLSPGELTTLWWYRASSKAMANPTIYVSKLSGELLASTTLIVGSTIGWKSAVLPTPVNIASGEGVIVWMHFSQTNDITISDSWKKNNNEVVAIGGFVSDGATVQVPNITSDKGFGFDIGFVSNESVPSIVTSTNELTFVVEQGSTVSASFDIATSDYSGANIVVSSQQPWINLDKQTGTDPFSVVVSIDGTTLSAGNYYGDINISSGEYPSTFIKVYVVVVANIERVFDLGAYPNAELGGGDVSYTVGNRFKFSVAGYVTELLIIKNSEDAQAQKVLYFRNATTQEVLGSTVITPNVDTGWLTAALPQAVSVNDTDFYDVYTLFSSTENFTRSPNLMLSSPVTNGSVSMVDGLYKTTGISDEPPNVTAPWGYGFDLGFTNSQLPKFIRPSSNVVAATIEGGQVAEAKFTVETSDLSSELISQTSTAPWLSVSPTSGVGPLEFTATIDATTLSGGKYNTSIRLFANGYRDFNLPVSLTVVAAKPTSNPISIENALAGTSAGFNLNVGALNGAPGYMGFSRDYSVNAGEVIDFSVDGAGVTELGIYRMGYYSGVGRREVAVVSNSGVAQTGGKIIPNSNNASTMEDWINTASWLVPANTVSGLFVAVTRDTNGDAGGWIPFVVRNDGRDADLVVMTSDSTWGCAYNYYGDSGSEFSGASVYGSGGPLGGSSARAYAVSRDRPIVTKDTIVNHWDQLELPLIDWLEENGFDVKYIGNYDLDQQNVKNVLDNSKNLVSIGHDEYWSTGMRDNAKAFRDSGKNLIFMSGNEVFWKVFWADNGRTMWCYKDTLNDGVQINPAVEWTGTWKDTRWVDREPEYWITGDNFRMNGINDKTMTVVASEYGGLPFWRNTSVASGSNLSVPGIIGFEANSYQPPDSGAVRLAKTYLDISGSYADDNGQFYNGSGFLDWGPIMFYATPTAGITLGFGTNQWQWGLSSRHPRLPSVQENTAVKQATANILYDLGCYAMTIQSEIAEPVKFPIGAYGVVHTGINPIEPWPPPSDSGTAARFGDLQIKSIKFGSVDVVRGYLGSTPLLGD